jgi:hypothetical protein
MTATAVSMSDLLAQASALKERLVAHGYEPRYERALARFLADVGLEDADPDAAEVAMTMYVDTFLLQHRLKSGKTIVERFVALEPDLSPEDRAMMLGWQDVVEGTFEVAERRGDHCVLRCLADDLTYAVYPNAGPGMLRQMKPGCFYLGRIVPLHGAAGTWMFSAFGSTLPRRSAPEAAQFAIASLQADPTMFHRNPELLERARQIQREDREVFIQVTGSDLVTGPAAELRALVAEHQRRRAATQFSSREIDEQDLEQLAARMVPSDVPDDETITILYDETDGFGLYWGFAELEDACSRPGSAGRVTLNLLTEMLDDESVDPVVFRRLAERNPDGIDAVMRRALKRPRFTWATDGDALLRERKAWYYERGPRPGVLVIPDRLKELLAR